MTNRRRIFLIVISVGIGTLLSGLMFYRRRGSLTAMDYQSLFVSLLFTIGVIVALILIFRGADTKNKQ